MSHKLSRFHSDRTMQSFGGVWWFGGAGEVDGWKHRVAASRLRVRNGGTFGTF